MLHLRKHFLKEKKKKKTVLELFRVMECMKV